MKKMKKIKNWKLFTEGYSEELSEVLANEENMFILTKGDNILGGFEFLGDTFDLLLDDLDLDEEQRFEFESTLEETLPSVGYEDDETEQVEIDELLSDILDQFQIIEPYKIQKRVELEETPIDPSLDEMEPQEELNVHLGEKIIHKTFDTIIHKCDCGDDCDCDPKNCKCGKDCKCEKCNSIKESNSHEEDCFISSDGFKYSVSCGSEYINDTEEMSKALSMVKKWQEENKFYPNIYFVSDHGNESQIDLEGNILEEEVTENKTMSFDDFCNKKGEFKKVN